MRRKNAGSRGRFAPGLRGPVPVMRLFDGVKVVRLVYSTRRRALEEVPHRVAVGIAARAAGELDHRAAPERANDEISQDR